MSFPSGKDRGGRLTSVCSRRAWVSRGLQGGALRAQHTPRHPSPAADTRSLGGPDTRESLIANETSTCTQ